MIQWDSENKQLTTSCCHSCPDLYFGPKPKGVPHVGCCSYSPVFGLFEIYKMVLSGERAFFFNHIYDHPDSTVKDYEIIVHAHVDPLFDQSIAAGGITGEDRDFEDIRLSYSVCRFFEQGKGCSLKPAFKNKVCRSFICTAVENMLSQDQADFLGQKAGEITREVEEFLSLHLPVLRSRGLNLRENAGEVLDYLEHVRT